MSDTDDIDDFLATLSTESAKAVPAKVVPKPKAAPLSGGSPNLLGMVVASNDDDDGDDIAAFLETTGLKADREVPDASKPWMKYHKFTRVQTIQEVNRIVNECIDRGTCSLDLETTGLDNRIIYKNGKPETVDQIVGFCISYDGYEGFYIPIRHKPADRGPSLNVEPVVEVERAITRLCRAAIPEGTAEDKAADSLSYKGVAQLVIFFWNAQFDHEFLYPVTGIDWWHPSSFEDGMLASFVKYAGDKGIGLKPKAKQLLIDPDGNPYEMIELKQLFQKGMPIRFDSLSPDEPGVIRYGGSDGICTYKLCIIPDLVPLCNAKYNFTYRLEKQLTCVLRVLERNRVRINRAPVRAMLEAKSKERDEILAKIRKFAKLKNTDLDPNSPKQLGEFLFGTGSNCMNITPKPAKNEASGQYKTDGATLEALAEDPNAPAILKDVVTYRGFEKSIGTYLIGLANNPDANDELRVSFKQTGASTGRFSAPAGDPEHGYSGIPIHGIPQGSDLRRVFEARPGYTMAKCDYAGEELRIAANVSGETVWINEFMHGSGDLHTITARAFFGKQEVTKDERNAGKCVHPETIIFINGVPNQIKSLPFAPEPDSFLPVSGFKVYSGSKIDSVTATYNGGEKPLVHVVTSGGILTCSLNHSFKLRDGSFVRAKDLTPGTLLKEVSLPLASDHPYPKIRVSLWPGLPSSTYALNHDWAYLAGVYAGDGSGTSSCLTLTHGEATKVDAYGALYEDWIQTLIKACAACEISTTRKDFGSLYLGSTVLVRLFQALDIHKKRSKALRIPFWILGSGRESILHYLGGLFDTDGTVSARGGNLDVTTKDFHFAGQLATAMRHVGLDFNLELTFNKTYKRYYVRIRLPINDSLSLKPYMKHVGKKGRLRRATYKGFKGDRFVVKKVLEAGLGQCVDISVGGTHTYVANGLLTHNTANFALLYGGGPKSIIRATGCNEVEARRRKQAFDKAVPTFAKWIKQQHAAVKTNLGVWTAFGRWLLIPDANSQEGEIRAACERHSVNFQIQGCLKFEARVLTNKGYIQIGELAKKNRPITVWTGTCWASAKAIDRGPCTLATIRLSDGTDVPCDTRHKLLVVTDEGYVWTDYKDLQPGMKIATSLCEPVEFKSKPLPPVQNRRNVFNHKPIVVPMDVVTLWYWLGRYMGDGWISEDGITYTFGTHEKQAVEDCAKFWATLGLNVTWKTTKHKPAAKEASRIKLDIYSENLVRWLASLGFKASTAHTKRVPEVVFRESLTHRRAFVQGMMESDGCFSKIKSYHGIHLCQRPLLEDFKLLFRTVGVESKICGPYTYANKKTKLVTVSYRLNIQNRMYEHELRTSSGFKFAPKDMAAPQFLINELIAQDPGTWGKKAFPDESSYTLYRRIATGGGTTVYTLKKLCEMLGVTLPSPIYGIKTLTSKTSLGRKEKTYTLSVDDPLHRFDALGVITKNSGADIMKIAMVLLHKAFHNKGWLRNGGDDSVRMLLTVHDEIVFEIKHERVVEVIPLIVEIMEGPWKRPKNPPWKVPLVVEPLVGFNWSSGYKVERHKKGQALGKGEVLANGYVYGTTRKPAKEYEQPDIGEIVLTPNKLFGLEHTPPWLASLVPSAEVIETPVIEAVQETPTKEAVQESQTKSAVQEIPTQDVPLENVPLENVPSESLSDLSEALLQVAEPQLTAPPEKLTQFPEPQTDGVIVFGIDRLNEQTAAQISDFVCVAMLEARRDGHGSILHLQDFGGETLIPISYNYRIQVSKFAELLRRHNLLVDK